MWKSHRTTSKILFAKGMERLRVIKTTIGSQIFVEPFLTSPKPNQKKKNLNGNNRKVIRGSSSFIFQVPVREIFINNRDSSERLLQPDV